MRRIPLLKDLPEALVVYLMDDEEMPIARRRGLDPLEYLSGKISDRVRHNNCCSGVHRLQTFVGGFASISNHGNSYQGLSFNFTD